MTWRTSAFTRAVPPRAMTMHVSRSPASSQDIGRGTDACHVSNDCLAAAGKTHFRAPFGGFSRATPVLLRPGAWASSGKNPSGQRHVRSPARMPETAGIADPGLPPDLQRQTGVPGPFSAGGGPFSARARWQGFASSPNHRHRSRLDASPCVVAVAGRSDSRTDEEGGEK